MSKDTMQIVLPYQADSDLVRLTEYLTKEVFGNEHQGGGLLGGEYGYGVDYENDVFMMHHYCWCEREDCDWCSEKHAPNFIYKPTDYRLWWYKYIGRDETSEGKLPKGWLEECKQSVTPVEEQV